MATQHPSVISPLSVDEVRQRLQSLFYKEKTSMTGQVEGRVELDTFAFHAKGAPFAPFAFRGSFHAAEGGTRLQLHTVLSRHFLVAVGVIVLIDVLAFFALAGSAGEFGEKFYVYVAITMGTFVATAVMVFKNIPVFRFLQRLQQALELPGPRAVR